MPDKVLADLRRRLDPLARKTPPLNVLPPRKTRFGSPLVLSRVHWVEPKLIAEITYLTWTADNLLDIQFTSAFARTNPRSRCAGNPR
jgi:ATP-dependent DNA ligase